MAQDCAKNPCDENRNLIKHFMLNSIRANFNTHKAKFGQMIIATDSHSWRRDYFPNYKCQRRAAKSKDDSGIRWDFVFSIVDDLILDLETKFPFPTIKVHGAEGDDIIAVLTKYIIENPSGELDIFGDPEVEPVVVLSSDRDNFQLHKHKNVRQFSPRDKKFIKPEVSWRQSLLEKIVKGESGSSSDSIPNIRMPDDTFVTGTRQKPIAQKYLDKFYANKTNPIDECASDEERVNFIRNETLVSYDKIPDTVSQSIISRYNEQLTQKHSKMELMSYFTSNRMSTLLGSITDFYK
jgi:T4 RNase H, C terminal/5'-3' exonuclease, N-terminal resolvase-like domain